MSLFVIYKPDGSIHASYKVYAPEAHLIDYAEELRSKGETFVTMETPGLLPPDQHYVHMNSGKVRQRPIMRNVRIDKTRIVCGDDVSIATGIPRDTTVYVMLRDGTMIDTPFKNSTGKLEISIPVPCSYRVVLEKFPYQNFVYEIEAVAP